ncbi:MAG: GUN4 domain-containing protein [Spirulinaceae cyanobacterium]
MTDEKPEKKETKTPAESKVAIARARKNAQGLVQTTVVPAVKSLVQFAPVGGSIVVFFSFLLQQQWVLVLITFPATILAVIWAAYSESVLTRFYEIYKERGAKDVDSLMAWIEQTDQAIKETIKWQLAGVDDKYLNVQGNTCKDFRTEGYKPGLTYNEHFLTEYKLQAQLFVKPFNRNQQERFINNWYWCQERLARGGRDTADVKAEAVNNAHNLLQQLNERLELNDLAKNPLLLNIITNLHRCYPTEELPKRRSELYREIVNLQLGNRPLARKIDLVLPLKEAQKVLQGLALYMVRENKPTIAEDVLLEQVKAPIESFDKSVVAKDFIKEIVDISELLVKRDENYEFAHLSFQGYLAAKEIIHINRGDLLIANWEKAWWRETILLYAAQFNPSQLVKALCELGKEGRREAILLAFNCLQESPRQLETELEVEYEELKLKLITLLYQPLENYLKNGQWEKADEETLKIMHIVAGVKEEEFFIPSRSSLNDDNIEEFSCEDLHKINNLWVKYSNGKLGFTVQRDIWLECGGQLADEYEWETYQKFAEKVKWYNREKDEWFEEIDYESQDNIAVGYLPMPIRIGKEFYVKGLVHIPFIAQRLAVCKI